MTRSVSSESRASNQSTYSSLPHSSRYRSQTPRTPQNLGGHSMFWWSLKIICGTTLIGALFLKVIYELTPWFSFPALVAQSLVLVGAGSTLWHYFKLKSSSHDISQPRKLVEQGGLFNVVRHPMYLSDMFVSSGLFLLFPTIPTACVLAMGILGMVRQSQVEDRYLQARFGDEFAEWKRKTKLIFPYIF